MTRFRTVLAVACLAVLLSAALPNPATAQRDAQQLSAIADGATFGEGFLASWSSLGRLALDWLRAIIAEEHGHIVESPVVPTPPPTTP
jgi:hypothetical protein